MQLTDMAVELVPEPVSRNIDERIKRTDIRLDARAAARFGKAPGRYITVESDAVVRGDREILPRLVRAVADVLRELLPAKGGCLVAALGNPDMTADALGARCARRIAVTRHLRHSGCREVSLVIPNVLGSTGIESAEIVLGAVKSVRPAAVVVIDSLASAATGRLAAAFQLTDTGITPGSGLDNHRMRLDAETLDTPVVGIGVPLVVYASTIIEEAGGSPAPESRRLVVTPKDIDVLVDDCAYVIAEALNTVTLRK